MMNTEGTLSLIDSDTLEIHYWFEDGTHTMNAVIQNRCEYEFLGLVKEVAASFGVDIVIETEPIAEGGLKRWFRILKRQENKTATVTTAVITTLVATLMLTPVTSAITAVINEVVHSAFEDKEEKALAKEKLRLEVEKLKQDLNQGKEKLIQSHVIRKKRSNFYQNLEDYPKVSRVSFAYRDDSKLDYRTEGFVDRGNFSEFVIVDDNLEPIEVDDEIIEIISPVLKKSSYKWMGIYKGEVVSFSMKSKEFKTLVQSGVVQFRNGTSINCLLVIKKKIDNEGAVKVIAYDVMRVNTYFENDKPIETPEGRHTRQKKEAEKNQLRLFANSTEDTSQ